MIDRRQAAQLLKSAWATPTELAQHIYSLLVSKQERVVESPVVIQAPPGRTALRVVSSPPTPEPHAQRPEAPRAFGAKLAPKDSGSKAQATGAPEPKPISTGDWSLLSKPPAQGASQPSRRPDDQPAPTQPQRGAPLASPGPSRPEAGPSTLYPDIGPPRQPQGPSRQADQPTRPPSYQSATTGVPERFENVVSDAVGFFKTAGQDAPKPRASDPQQPRPRPNLAIPAPYVPQVEFEGPARFGGSEPSRFDTPPSIWIPKRRDYAPLQEWMLEQFEQIPFAQYYYNPLMCLVTGGSGKKWKGDIYTFGPSNTIDSHITGANIVVKNVTDNWAAPVNQWIAPVIEIPNPDGASDNDFFFVVDPWQPGLACTTNTISAGGTGTCPSISIGSGPVNWLTWPGSGNTASNGSGTIYNMGGSVASGKIIQYKWIEGRPFVDVVLC